MAKRALIYNADGEVVGSVTCSNDDDMALQPHALTRLAEVAHDHPALRNPKGWEIRTEEGKKTVKEKAKP